MNYPDFLLSSKGYGLAMRWKAAVISIVPIAISLLKIFGIEWAETDVVLVIDGVLWFAVLMMYVWGVAVNKFNKDNKLGKYAPKG